MASSPHRSLTALAAAALHVGRNPERVLEISCGEGDGVLFLAREFPRARVRGVDADSSAIRAARKRIGLDPEGRVAFKEGRRRSLPFPDEHFDLVVQRQGSLFTSEVIRVLRPEGHLIYVTGRSRWGWLGAPPQRLGRPLRRTGVQTIQTGEADGEGFFVGRLDRDRLTQPE